MNFLEAAEANKTRRVRLIDGDTRGSWFAVGLLEDKKRTWVPCFVFGKWEAEPVKFEIEFVREDFRNLQVCHLPTCTTVSFVIDKKTEFNFRDAFEGKNLKLTIEVIP